MALKTEEVTLLCELLGKMEWPLPKEVFHALLPKFVSVPVELVVLNEQNEVLLQYRKDLEYDGYHSPGTVLRNNEKVNDALQRLLKGELLGSQLSPIQSIGWKEVLKGDAGGENPTRHEIALVFVAWTKYTVPGKFEFFPMDDLPHSTLSHHRTMIKMVHDWLGRTLVAPT